MIDIKQILTVNELNSLLKLKVEDEEIFKNVFVTGEISNLVFNKSGHIYFSLKDERSSINCMIWKTNAQILKKLNPTDGMKINVVGKISFYVPYGKISLEVNDVQIDGIGELQQIYDQRKEELASLGWFDQSLKKPLPQYPQNIGIVTADTGAVIHDLITTITRRWPVTNIFLFPAKVQGKGASADLANKIIQANNFVQKLDVLIVGRGGGSYEDLWEFNEMPVLTAIRNSKIPVISAVGHEPDVTLADYVADKRAPTPTAAGELATPSLKEINQSLAYQQATLFTLIQNLFKQNQILIKNLGQELQTGLINKQAKQEVKIQHHFEKLNYLMETISTKFETKFEHHVQTLKLLNPNLPLEKGYALIFKNGQALNKHDLLTINDEIVIKRSQQKLVAKINKEIEENKNEK